MESIAAKGISQPNLEKLQDLLTSKVGEPMWGKRDYSYDAPVIAAVPQG